jgi:GT2 family glycosyltransferase
MSSNLFNQTVYAIIPVYNRKDTTLTCLQHLKKCGYLQIYHIVVVDDASTDGTVEAIHHQYPEVTVLPGNGNLWWTGAIALGMDYACTKGAKYIFWLNDDCLPEDTTLPMMLEFMETHPNALVAPTCYARQSNSLVKTHNGFQGRKSFAAEPGEVIPVDGMSGWCVGMPASVFHKIGSPNISKYPHYAGDDMYTLKATRSGYSAFLLGKAKANLIGQVHPKLDFKKHFDTHSTPLETFQSLFWSKKSPYRLATQYFRHTERYGLILGLPIFLFKLISWLGQWLRYQLINFYNPDVIKINDDCKSN